MQLSPQEYNAELLAFLQASPTPYHAVSEMARQLESAGFKRLSEGEAWHTEAGGRYFCTRSDASILAWTLPKTASLEETGFRMVGAHTDSPCLKVKPNPALSVKGYSSLGVEVYGGVLLNPWFDRDLSLAGRVVYENTQGELKTALVDFKKPIAVIPSLAIHLDREANSNRVINAQTYLPPILGQEGKLDFNEVLAEQLTAQGVVDIATNAEGKRCVVDYDMSFYDCQAPSVVGLNDDFICSARLDNLLSCFIGLKALVEASSNEACLFVSNDHEEVGSASAAGAQGPMLANLLERLVPNNEARVRMINRSMMISADNAHGIHPNFAQKHDGNHGPILNEGPVIKVNANQRYATSSDTSAIFKQVAARAGVDIQSFVVRSDMACGSTIGPITASAIGVKTLDVGVPQFAMHSIRETAGSRDAYKLSEILEGFYQLRELPYTY